MEAVIDYGFVLAKQNSIIIPQSSGIFTSTPVSKKTQFLIEHFISES
jgi:hypothetical protein